LVTAIICGIVIGALSGAPYQISGPTGALELDDLPLGGVPID
jgi:MFS superfamily sulfate permease-like transporter